MEERSLTSEHVIPESIGGQLVVDFLCKSCNDYLGHAVDAAAKRDPSVALAIHTFSARYPDRRRSLNEGMAYVVQSADGCSGAVVKNRGLRLRSEQLSDGSLIQPTNVARRSVETMLRKSGYPEPPLQAALREFDAAPDNKRVEIVPGLEVAKWRVSKVTPDLSGPVLSSILPVKIAYEFLACHMGDAIYTNAAPLQAIRRALQRGTLDDDGVRVEALRADQSRPIHGIVVERGEPNVQMQIRLFGSIAYRVYFTKVGLTGARFVYTYELDSDREGVQLVPHRELHHQAGA